MLNLYVLAYKVDIC